MIKAHIITGQTAAGKTSYALNFAKQNNGYLVNADSRQVYKYTNIVTGKDSEGTFIPYETYTSSEGHTIDLGYYPTEGVEIWGYDLLPPDLTFSAHDYADAVSRIMSITMNKKRVPIVVGGTYLYLRSITEGFNTSAGPDWNLREQLAGESTPYLQDRLQRIAPNIYDSLNESDQNNPHRLIRKIELSQAKPAPSKPRQPIVKIQSYTGLKHESESALRSRISARVEKRLHAGALEEVKHLLSQGYTSADPGLNTIGYKQLIAHVQGEYSLEAAKELWCTAEVQYAKRQYTFMKKDTAIHWQTV